MIIISSFLSLLAAYIDLLYIVTSRHERYLGMWLDDLQCGPGVIVNSIGTYLEAIFANGGIAVSVTCCEGKAP